MQFPERPPRRPRCGPKRAARTTSARALACLGIAAALVSNAGMPDAATVTAPASVVVHDAATPGPGAAAEPRAALASRLLPLMTGTTLAPEAMLAEAARARAEPAVAADPAQLALVLAVECRARFRLQQTKEARRDCDEALGLATRSSDDTARMVAHRMRGITIAEGGRPAEAMPDFLAALAIAERLDDARAIAVALGNLGAGAQFSGVNSDAIEYYERAVAYAGRSGEADLRATLGNNLGHLLVENGDPAGAIEQFRQALPLAESSGNAVAAFNIRSGLGNAELARGDAARAVQLLRAVLAGPSAGLDARQLGESRFFLARAELAAGLAVAAESSARAAVAVLDRASPVRGYPAWATLVEALAARGKLDEALATVDALLARMPLQARGRVEALQARARVLAKRQSHREAYEALLEAQRLRDAQVTQRTRERMEYMRFRTQAAARELEVARLRASEERQAATAARDRLTRNFLLALLAVLLLGAALAWRIVRARRALETQIERSQHLDVLARLTGGVAHDFNNLMTVVCQSMNLLRLQPGVRDAPAAMELVDEAEDAARVGGRITQQLLAFARQQPMRPEIVRLQAFCDEHRALFERTLGEGIVLRIELPPEPLAIRVDRGELATAVMNLLVNARDASDGRGEVRLRGEALEIAGRDFDWPKLAPGRHVALGVADRGSGMSPEVLRDAVTPFFTTRRDRGGTGLGLSMVDGFVAQSRGRLFLRSSPGAGATVTMVFPADC